MDISRKKKAQKSLIVSFFIKITNSVKLCGNNNHFQSYSMH